MTQKYFRFSRRLLFSVAVSAICCALTAAQTSSFISFNAPGAGTGAYQGTRPTSISQNGEVAGFYIDPNGLYHGFFRQTNGHISSFDVPGLPGSLEVLSVNISGQIAGDGEDSKLVSHGYIRNANGTFIVFDPPGSIHTGVGRLNDSGEITGYYEDASQFLHGYIRDAAGNYTVIDDPEAAQGEGLGTIPIVINNAGVIAGQYNDANTGTVRAFIRDQFGNFTNFDAVASGSLEIFPEAINSNNQITGIYYNGDVIFHSFFRDTDGTVTDFDLPNATKGTAAYGMNDNAIIVGQWTNPALLTRGFQRSAAGTLISFSAPQPTNGTFPAAINNKHTITGYYYDSSNVPHGFLK